MLQDRLQLAQSCAQSRLSFLLLASNPLSPLAPGTESQRVVIEIYPNETGHPFENKLRHK